jgi:hypothetical protein
VVQDMGNTLGFWLMVLFLVFVSRFLFGRGPSRPAQTGFFYATALVSGVCSPVAAGMNASVSGSIIPIRNCAK